MLYLSQMVSGQQQLREVTAPEFTKEYDVIVCGLGTAGAYAALFCGENGLSVLGVEPLTCVGGTHTAGGVAYHYFGRPGGRYEAIDEQAKAFAQRYTCTLVESRTLLLEQALLRQSVELLYQSSVCGVYLNDNKVIGLQVITEQGIENFGAKFVFDCTADACVAAIAGCATEQGRESDGQMQPYSLVCMIHKGTKYSHTNVDFGRVDQCDPVAYSQAVLFSRSCQIQEGLSNATLISQMPMLGFREGRRIIPEETVRLEDLFADHQTDTPMFYAYADLDKHGWDIALDSACLGDWAIGANLGAYNVTIAVPYKALLPKDYDGILVPCRAFGVDRDIASCTRMNHNMKRAAETAAEWVTLAICQEKTLREVSYAQLRERLIASECLKESDNTGYRVDGRINWDGSALIPRDVHWLTDPEKLGAILETQAPGEGIWSAKRIGKKALPVLREYLAASDENLRKHAAFAVAILGSGEANDILRDMVLSRDGVMLTDCRKHNNLRGCIAIYHLGRLGDRQIVPELISLIGDPKEAERPVYHNDQILTTRYKISDFQALYFQFMSQAVAALVRIGDAHPDLRPEITQGFLNAFSTDDYFSRITTRPAESSEGNMALSIKNLAFSTIKKWETLSKEI